MVSLFLELLSGLFVDLPIQIQHKDGFISVCLGFLSRLKVWRAWVMTLSASWAMLMKGCCAPSAETCWKIHCRLLVNTLSALPVSMAGLFITVTALKTDK